jgi:hypothetical protein
MLRNGSSIFIGQISGRLQIRQVQLWTGRHTRVNRIGLIHLFPPQPRLTRVPRLDHGEVVDDLVILQIGMAERLPHDAFDAVFLLDTMHRPRELHHPVGTGHDEGGGISRSGGSTARVFCASNTSCSSWCRGLKKRKIDSSVILPWCRTPTAPTRNLASLRLLSRRLLISDPAAAAPGGLRRSEEDGTAVG